MLRERYSDDVQMRGPKDFNGSFKVQMAPDEARLEFEKTQQKVNRELGELHNKGYEFRNRYFSSAYDKESCIPAKKSISRKSSRRGRKSLWRSS